jgi:hypothetical protein
MFVAAVTERDFGRLAGTLAPDVRMRALTPSGPVELSGGGAVAVRFAFWFGEANGLELVHSGSGEVRDRLHVFYRVRVKRPGDPWKVVGFSDEANLDEGAMWPTSFALKELTAAEEAKIGALVKKAMS